MSNHIVRIPDLELRDLFAAAALGVLATRTMEPQTHRAVADAAYAFADAMLARRNLPREGPTSAKHELGQRGRN